MRGVIQRVTSSEVKVDGAIVGKIDEGLLLFLGIKEDDTEKDIDYIISKTINLRIFEDDEGKMNLSLIDTEGGILVVSQFTLYGDCRKGRRPGFSRGGSIEEAEKKYDLFIKKIKEKIPNVQTGKFQEEMAVSIENDGPVTLLLDSEKIF